MPVKIPTVERLQPIQPGSVGRVEAQVPDAARSLAQTTKDVTDLTSNLVRVADKVERDTIDIKGNEAINKYERWYRRKIYGDATSGEKGLVHIEGDPTEAYKAFDEESVAYKDEVLKDLNLSGRVRRGVQKKLDNRYNSLYNKTLSVFSSQYDKYDERTTEAQIKNSKRDAAESTSFIDKDDPLTFQPFENALVNVKNLTIQRGKRLHTVREIEKGDKLLNGEERDFYFDADGEKRFIALKPSVQLKIAQDLSEATSGAIKTLMGARRIDEAKVMMDEYKKYLDPVAKAKLEDKLEGLEVEQKAYQALAEGKDAGELPTRTARDAMVKKKAYELQDAMSRYRENKTRRESDNVYNQLATQLMEKVDPAKTKNPIDNTLQLDQEKFLIDGKSVKFEDAVDRIVDAKQQKALYALVQDRSKTGDPGKMAELLDRASTGEFYTMSAEDLLAESYNLSEKEYNRVLGIWQRMRLESDSSEGRRLERAFKIAKERGLQTGLLRKSRRTKSGLTRQSEKLLRNMRIEIYENPELYSPGKGTGTQEIYKLVNKVISREVRKKNIEEAGRFWNRLGNWLGIGDDESERPKNNLPQSDGAVFDLSPEEQLRIWDEYEKANGKPPASGDELNRWYLNQKGK